MVYYIFLDIDGVLNDEDYIIGLDSDEEFNNVLNLFTQKYTN